MKERPILFSGQMVCAILKGWKTQTRRVVKPQPPPAWEILPVSVTDGRWTSHGCVSDLRCPYGTPGDRLWVRETWRDDSVHGFDPDGTERMLHGIAYRADDLKDEWKGSWRPSIFMPRKWSRITLEVTGVRVERVQEISEEDAKSEGVEPCHDDNYHGYKLQNGEMILSARDAFHDLWDSINASQGYSWESNPWVFVIEFKVVRQAR